MKCKTCGVECVSGPAADYCSAACWQQHLVAPLGFSEEQTNQIERENSMAISISLNCSLLQKERFFKGKKGTYCDLVLWESPNSKYGDDFIVKQRGQKDERMPIVGNARHIKQKGPGGETSPNFNPGEQPHN